jgi:tetratricopeptide (TPR) repeat protein
MTIFRVRPEPNRGGAGWSGGGKDVVQHATTWLNAHPASPRFVWIHLYDPHDPYEPPPPYSEIYKQRLYDGEIAYADSVVAGFVSFLKKHAWYDHSIIVVVGDHGEGLGEHHEETHGIFLYDSTTHVPLIMKMPNQRTAGRVVKAQVRTLDILPTVLDLLHDSLPARLDGKSLRSYFSAGQDKDRIVFGETDYPLRFGWAPLRSIRADGLKFIEAPRPELYDLRREPQEEANNYAPWDPNVQKFRAMLKDWHNQNPPSTSAGAVPQSTLDELKALGYLTRADAASSSNLTERSLLPDPKDKIEEQNLLHRAMIASEDGRSAEARAALEKVVDLDPKSGTALGQLGQLELQAEDYPKAALHLTLARQLRPDDSTLAFDEGRAKEKNGDLAGSKEALEASLRGNPARLAARLLLGEVDLRLKDLKAAEDEFEAALLLQPENMDAQLGKAKVLLASGRLLEAVKQLEAMVTPHASNPEIFDLLAQSYAALGKRRRQNKRRSGQRLYAKIHGLEQVALPAIISMRHSPESYRKSLSAHARASVSAARCRRCAAPSARCRTRMPRNPSGAGRV